MIVDCGKSITFTDTIVVDFFTKHFDNASLQEGAVDLMVSYCKTMTLAMNSYETEWSKERQENAVITYLRSMEKRVEDRLTLHATDSKHAIDRMERSVGSIPSQLQGMISTMVTNLEQAVHCSMKTFNVDSIAAQVSSNVKEWVGSDLQALKDTNTATQNSVERLLASIHETLRANITVPFDQRITRLQDMVKSVPSQVVTLWSSSPADKASRDLVQSNISELRKKLDEVSTYHRSELSSVLNTLQSVRASCKDADVRKHLPLVKSAMTETVKYLEQQTAQCIEVVNSSQLRLVHMEQQLMNSSATLSSIQDADKNLMSKLDEIGSKNIVNNAKAMYNTGAKGKAGEQRLCDELAHKLTVRDGYEVDIVSGMAHQCDIAVKRLGFPEIRIESKAHGDSTGEKVRAKEVARFQSDILALNLHGIFVSLHSNIVGKGAVEVEQLTNGKFVIYLSNNNYDIDQVVDMLRLLYKLDTYSTDAERDGVKFSNDTLKRVQLMITSLNDKIKATKSHLKESITLLNDVSLDMLENILISRDDDRTKEVIPAESHQCPHCPRAFPSKKGLATHVTRLHSDNV
jgi:hypothetical protein